MSKGDPQQIIFLASASPRRRDIFTLLGIPFEAVSADVDEAAIMYTVPRELAIKAAYEKALEVESRVESGVVVAADTIVVLDSAVFCKPSDPEEAIRMLSELAGRWHKVITGVAVKEVGRSVLIDAVETSVMIRDLSSAEIAGYVETGEPLDKAGGYAAQGEGRKLIANIAGDFYNVVGLPVKRTLDMLDSFVDTSSYRCNYERLEKEYGEPVIH